MVALPRRVFERGGDVTVFEQGVVFQNLIAAGPGARSAIFGHAALTSGKAIDRFDATTVSPFSTSKS
jgi:hypothetical protein